MGLADKIYFLPVTIEPTRNAIKLEKPDGISVPFGGQTALGGGIDVKDKFEALGVKVFETRIQTTITAEDRQLLTSPPSRRA